MKVGDTLREALARATAFADEEDREAAARWVARVLVLLEWIASHPNFEEIRSEAGALLHLYWEDPKAVSREEESSGRCAGAGS